MAYKSCAAKLAASIAMDCTNPIVAGHTGRAIIINHADAVIVRSAENPRIITSIVVAESAKPFVIDNAFVDPFSGSTTTSNTDSGMVTFTKNLSILIPQRGADTSKDIVEPLMKSPDGFIIIKEMRDKRGIGSFVVLGAEEPAKADPTSYTRDEGANHGAASLTLTCNEHYEEVDYFDTDYATTKAAFDALVASAA